jgi:hypothetical protein
LSAFSPSGYSSRFYTDAHRLLIPIMTAITVVKLAGENSWKVFPGLVLLAS